MCCKGNVNRAKNQILFKFFRSAAYLRLRNEVKDTKNQVKCQIKFAFSLGMYYLCTHKYYNRCYEETNITFCNLSHDAYERMGGGLPRAD